MPNCCGRHGKRRFSEADVRGPVKAAREYGVEIIPSATNPRSSRCWTRRTRAFAHSNRPRAREADHGRQKAKRDISKRGMDKVPWRWA